MVMFVFFSFFFQLFSSYRRYTINLYVRLPNQGRQLIGRRRRIHKYDTHTQKNAAVDRKISTAGTKKGKKKEANEKTKYQKALPPEMHVRVPRLFPPSVRVCCTKVFSCTNPSVPQHTCDEMIGNHIHPLRRRSFHIMGQVFLRDTRSTRNQDADFGSHDLVKGFP